VIYSGTPRPSPPSVARAAAISNRASGFSPQWRGFVDAKGSSMPAQMRHIYCLRFEAAAFGIIASVTLGIGTMRLYLLCRVLLSFENYSIIPSTISPSLSFSLSRCRRTRCRCGFPTRVAAFLSAELFQVDYITQRIYSERREHQGEPTLLFVWN